VFYGRNIIYHTTKSRYYLFHWKSEGPRTTVLPARAQYRWFQVIDFQMLPLIFLRLMMVFNRYRSQVFTSKCGPSAMSSSPGSSISIALEQGAVAVINRKRIHLKILSNTFKNDWQVLKYYKSPQPSPFLKNEWKVMSNCLWMNTNAKLQRVTDTCKFDILRVITLQGSC